MSSLSIKLSGVIPPVITPLTSTGELDVDGLDRLLNHMIESGVSGVFVLGSSGEGPWVTPDMQNQVVRETIRIVNQRVPVLAGALEPIAHRALEMIQHHADAGVHAVVVTSPYYFAADAETQRRHFESVADASPLPIMLYNIPIMTHNPLPVDTVKSLAAHENIIGIKDSAGNMDDFCDLLLIREQYPDFVIFQGAERFSAEAMIAGADGIVPGLSNLVPASFTEITRLVYSGKNEKAKEVQEQLNQLGTLYNHDYWLVCLKYAASLLGFGSGAGVGHPLQLSETDKTSIRDIVNQIIHIKQS